VATEQAFKVLESFSSHGVASANFLSQQTFHTVKDLRGRKFYRTTGIIQARSLLLNHLAENIILWSSTQKSSTSFLPWDAMLVRYMALCQSVHLSVCHKPLFYQNG